MSGKMVQIKMWTLVVCSFFVGALANGNITDQNSVLKPEVIPPPLIFPNNSAEIKVNETAREILQKNVGETEESATLSVNKVPKPEEMTTMTNLKKFVPKISYQSTTKSIQPIQLTNQSTPKMIEKPLLFSPFTPSNTTSEKPKHNPKEDSEWIQVNGENSEDEMHPSLGRRDMMSPQRNHGPGVPLVRGQLAAILAGIFVVLAVGGYIALLSWRRYLENRYGNREMLVNEEEMSEATDMKYFSVSKL